MRLLKHFTANEEQLESFPFKRELSMESYLVENEGILALDNDSYSDVTIVQEELTLKRGRSSKDTDGRIDILATYSSTHASSAPASPAFHVLFCLDQIFSTFLYMLRCEFNVVIDPIQH